ncbi:putative nucleotidyltransferase substrate binding domain-containing protein [Thalassotalea agarivorans]|uniref:CBS domain-containing protein n=1 Tax=Thalassotalea agarivorans TaxID=349064 RepID=A0A1I0CLA5_THASX|nr:putative nucleotidyltransferase substrate binding domain-containing protein [Thalassotalea agarivorans]SET20252.1 CBS domain-containing protein [Thalassotalea agarivorans]
MDNELAELMAFVKDIPPFDTLPNDVVNQIVREMSICYVRQSEQLPPAQVDTRSLFILRKGALSYYAIAGDMPEFLGMYGEGDICTVFFDDQEAAMYRVAATEDTLLYAISWQQLLTITASIPAFAAFFKQSAEERLNQRMEHATAEAVVASSLSNALVTDFYHTPVSTIAVDATIVDCAKKMSALRHSCLVVMEKTTPVGIVTDKDIRRRCVAAGLATSELVKTIMTPDILSIDGKMSAYDALMIMTSKHLHHLPVMEFGELTGMVTVTDLINQEGHNAIHIASLISKAKSVEALATISKMLPQLQVRMTKLGSSADHVAKSMSAITAALTTRLLSMAEDIQGPPPVPYAWLAAGSQARQEQLSNSDQDNALIISDEMQPEHDYYFYDLATFVCDGLAACGFVYCPGEVMATNPKWRKTQKGWHKYFQQWVDKPDPKALMHSSIFFDLVTVHGDENLLEEVRGRMLQKTQNNTLFIAHLTRNALSLRPPLGFFRDFVLISEGENKATLDLKHNGIAPIVDLARIYALSEGISEVNTLTRLKLAGGTKSLTQSSADNLIDAFEFLNMLRMEHQLKNMIAGNKANNFLSPKSLSKLEREHLKDAFKVIKTLQDARQSTY